MPALSISLVLITAISVGLILHFMTGATLASYAVAVLAMAAGWVALFLQVSKKGAHGPHIRSKIRLKRSKNATVTGIALRSAPKNIDSSLRVDEIDGGEVTGVREE
jgi:hypothetical protein